MQDYRLTSEARMQLVVMAVAAVVTIALLFIMGGLTPPDVMPTPPSQTNYGTQ